jgi:hypothetical protein
MHSDNDLISLYQFLYNVIASNRHSSNAGKLPPALEIKSSAICMVYIQFKYHWFEQFVYAAIRWSNCSICDCIDTASYMKVGP